MAEEDRAYSETVKDLPCAMCGARPRSQQHHRSGAGMAQRAHDHDSMPLCRRCHLDVLPVMPKDVRRDFEERAIAETQALLSQLSEPECTEEVF